jgi:hypothetical protein
MSYIQYTRPKASLSCSAVNARGMGQDTTATDTVTGFSIPNPLTIFSNLFSSTDFSTWGIGEWIVIAGVGFLALKLVTGVLSAGSAVKSTVRKRQRRSKKKQDLLDKLRDL